MSVWGVLMSQALNRAKDHKHAWTLTGASLGARHEQCTVCGALRTVPTGTGGAT